MQQIILANPMGFCAGVERAINIVEHALRIYKAPIYVKHELVHNKHIINNFHKRGVIFIESISQVPDNAVLIFSAHGVSKKIKYEVNLRKFTMVYDATCPLVTRVHMDVKKASNLGKEIILIGHAGHPEVEGTIGQYDNKKAGIYLIESENDIYNLKIKNENHLCYMTQTTLSISDTKSIINALHIRFPKITGPRKEHICYATTNRQIAVNTLINKIDILIVVGSKNSSNSNRLLEIGQQYGIPSFLIDYPKDIQIAQLNNIKNIGITAGASTPNFIVQNIINYIKKTLKITTVIKLPGVDEKIIFPIPKKFKDNLINYKTIK
uniref:4-hydroxy-3-methylbut-2-enyl diphosphate reductase n=1 Tax=Candidatus Aschnera chinzeii TaxID=1485666 RepID=A0AAT9G5A2_9ENTR|nr:MAG: 4-hydroxy-3-methylbut-2-enyl diphosphate reductase [Candidatus Aschnera chinzeii]